MKTVHLYLLCYNEEHMIGTTLKHYRTRFPNIKITVCDNESTDSSVEIAKKHDCEIHLYKSEKKINEFIHHDIKENLWKKSEADWIITADMDELLYMSQKDLEKEDANGVTIITTQGYNMVADSKRKDLSDIELERVDEGRKADSYSKKICFKRREIDQMNFDGGAHHCCPVGRKVQFSEKIYSLYHFKFLGFPFLYANYSRNFKRSHDMRRFNMALHYTGNKEQIRKIMEGYLNGDNVKLATLYELWCDTIL